MKHTRRSESRATRNVKPAAKKPAKRAAAATAKKAAARKTAAAPTKKIAVATATAGKTAAKNTAAKKIPAKAPVKKRAPAKTTAPVKTGKKKAVAAKKNVARKAAPKKAVTKKAVTKKATATAVARKPVPRKTAPVRRPKRFTAPETAHGFGFPPGAPDLPEAYGEDRLVLMTKDPEYLFAYWELTPASVAAAEASRRKGEEYREVMRLDWTARELFEANYALLPVSFAARRWYLRVPYPGLSYQLELGWLGSQGHYIPLLQSNPSDAPETWEATRKRLKAAGSAGPDGVLSRLLDAAAPQGASQPPPDTEHDARPDAFGMPGAGGSSSGRRA